MKNLILVLCLLVFTAPPASAGCFIGYGGLSARQFKAQSDSLGKEVQRKVEAFRDPDDSTWWKNVSVSVDVTRQNAAVRAYVTCLYENSPWYTASIVNIGGRDWLIVKGT